MSELLDLEEWEWDDIFNELGVPPRTIYHRYDLKERVSRVYAIIEARHAREIRATMPVAGKPRERKRRG